MNGPAELKALFTASRPAWRTRRRLESAETREAMVVVTSSSTVPAAPSPTLRATTNPWVQGQAPGVVGSQPGGLSAALQKAPVLMLVQVVSRRATPPTTPGSLQGKRMGSRSWLFLLGFGS